MRCWFPYSICFRDLGMLVPRVHKYWVKWQFLQIICWLRSSFFSSLFAFFDFHFHIDRQLNWFFFLHRSSSHFIPIHMHSSFHLSTTQYTLHSNVWLYSPIYVCVHLIFFQPIFDHAYILFDITLHFIQLYFDKVHSFSHRPYYQ